MSDQLSKLERFSLAAMQGLCTSSSFLDLFALADRAVAIAKQTLVVIEKHEALDRTDKAKWFDALYEGKDE